MKKAIECEATAMIDGKEGGDAFLIAFDKQLLEFDLEVVSWDTGQDCYAWKITRKAG